MADADLMALAARVEAVIEPDFRIEREIALACGWTFELVTHDDDMRDVEWRDPAGKSVQGPPFFMRRVDDAMLLVPANHTVQLSDWEDERLRARGPWQAIVLPMGVRGRMTDYTFSNRCDHAATAALALTVACLRSLAEIDRLNQQVLGYE